MRPLLDQHAKEGKDKKVVFDAGFTKPNCKPKWFCRKDVSTVRMESKCVIHFYHDENAFFEFTGTLYRLKVQVQE